MTSRADGSAGWGQARYDFEARAVTLGQTTGYATRCFDRWVLDWKLGDVGFELRAPTTAFPLTELAVIAAETETPAR